jgi:RNA polymerase sigma-54 factor
LNLIKGIESRKRLLYRIINYIIISQEDFFVKGKEFIKPISIKQTAEALGVHISTLSRACQSKYIETPVGIFSMKYFFTTGIGDLSRHSIKEKIRDLINNEDKTKPFTDDEMVNLLVQQNIHLSRRTVAKYREELNISGSSERNEKR